MKIINARPPHWDKLKEHFPGIVEEHVVITYGSALYIPGGGMPDEDLLKHEQMHSLQQEGMGIEEWWDRYFTDKDFRFKQEVEAYRAQYKNYVRRVKNRDQRAGFLSLLVRDLAGPTYGNCCTRNEAYKAISKGIE